MLPFSSGSFSSVADSGCLTDADFACAQIEISHLPLPAFRRSPSQSRKCSHHTIPSASLSPLSPFIILVGKHAHTFIDCVHRVQCMSGYLICWPTDALVLATICWCNWLKGEHLRFIQPEDDAVYFPGAPDSVFGTFSIALMTNGLTSHLTLLPATLLSRFSFGILMLNGKYLQSNLICQILLGRESNCRHCSFYYAGEHVLSSPAVPSVVVASLLMSKCSPWLLELEQWAQRGHGVPG